MQGLVRCVCMGIRLSSWHSWLLCSCRTRHGKIWPRTRLGGLLGCLLLCLLLLLLPGIRHLAMVYKAVYRSNAVQS